MKTKPQKTRLAILSILAICLYIYMILASFVGNWDSFKTGFEEGSSLKMKTYFIKLKPIDGAIMFPDSIKNEASGELISFRNSCIVAQTNSITEETKGLFVYNLIAGLMIFVLIICNIVIPVFTFKLFRSLSKEMIFTKQNISYIKRVGWGLIIWFFSEFLWSLMHFKINSTLFRFENYEIAPYDQSYYILLLGVITLIIAEIISRAVSIKEEQDLTI